MARVRETDRIYVLDHGAVVEEGDHDALMARAGSTRTSSPCSGFSLQRAYQPDPDPA
jgi:ABC-type glutathione transport system ATPase component